MRYKIVFMFAKNKPLLHEHIAFLPTKMLETMSPPIVVVVADGDAAIDDENCR